MLVSTNEVNPRLARLVPGWVTLYGFNLRCGTLISVFNQPPMSTQPGHPYMDRKMRTSQRVVALWLGNTDKSMVRVWVAGKTVWSHWNQWQIWTITSTLLTYLLTYLLTSWYSASDNRNRVYHIKYETYLCHNMAVTQDETHTWKSYLGFQPSSLHALEASPSKKSCQSQHLATSFSHIWLQ